MRKTMDVIVAYSTITGNTEICADFIREILEGLGHEVTVQDASETYSFELENYDLIILGSPTYGYGDVTAQFQPLLENMSSLDLSGKRAAVFGLGDSEMYPDDFATSTEVLENVLTVCGATLATDPLKIDGNPTEFEDDIKQWAYELGRADFRRRESA
jgi:flavodoxin I